MRQLNFESKTQYERMQANKEAFRKLMPLLSELDAKEQRDLIHMLESESFKGQYLDSLVSNDLEEQLAKISERENYAKKNAYVHNARTMQYADKSKMPIDERKVKDILRNQHIIRNRMN